MLLLDYCEAAYRREPRASRDEKTRPVYHATLGLVAERLQVSRRKLEARRGRLYFKPPSEVVVARHLALYLAVVVFNRSVRSVARVARITPQGVLKAVRATEDRREDEEFEALIAQMEMELVAC